MLYHSCNNTVYLDMSEILKLLVTYGYGNSGLTIAHGELIDVKKTKEKPRSNFFCPSCKKAVAIEELHSHCLQCGGDFGLKDLYKPNDCGGIYCDNCCTLLRITDRKNLLLVVNFVDVKG